MYYCVLPQETYVRMNKNYGILITSVALFFLVIQIYFFVTVIASKEEKRLEVTALKENEEIVALLKASNATPIARILDSLMSVNKTVGRNVYIQIRNRLDTIVDSTGESLRDKLDKISAISQQMIQDGYTVDEAAEYFETETKRILDDSTADQELVSAIIKYEKDVNRGWFPKSKTSKTASDTTDKF